MEIEKIMIEKKNTIRILLAVITIILSLFLFGKIYYDSTVYIWYSQYFQGHDIQLIATASNFELYTVRAPFLYRPLLPFLAAIFSWNGASAGFMMSLMNMGFLVVLTDSIFNICTLLSKKVSWALISTLIATVCYPLIFFGAVPLMDALSMLIFVGIIGCAELNYGDECAAFLIFVGVFVKEIILILGLYYVIRTNWKRIWVLIPGGIAALSLRFMFGFHNTIIFTLNIFDRPIEVIGMFGITFGIPVLMALYFWLKGSIGTHRGKKVLIAGFIATIPIVILGLFFAYFDGRFIWPSLIIASLYISSMR